MARAIPGESNVPEKSLPVCSIFYVLDSILCATVEQLASKRLLCLQNSTILGLNIFYYFNFTIIIQANTYSTRLGIGTEAKCLLSSSPYGESST